MTNPPSNPPKENPAQSTGPELPVPSRIGQGTVVEQTRAAAEVHAAIVVAQQHPRNEHHARVLMKKACADYDLADRAFYSYPRGDTRVSGPTVQLARELARCWGNIQHGIVELRRDDKAQQSEMMAYAWDTEANVRVSHTFISPHKRDNAEKGPQPLHSMRDIYENNANNGARRLRECIFAVLPSGFVENAKSICRQTLEQGDGTPLDERITAAIAGFAKIGVTVDQLVEKLGTPRADWSKWDVSQLGVDYRSIQNGEARKEELFPPSPPRRATVEEITGVAASGGGDDLAPANVEAAAEARLGDPLSHSSDEITEETNR